MAWVGNRQLVDPPAARITPVALTARASRVAVDRPGSFQRQPGKGLVLSVEPPTDRVAPVALTASAYRQRVEPPTDRSAGRGAWSAYRQRVEPPTDRSAGRGAWSAYRQRVEPPTDRVAALTPLSGGRAERRLVNEPADRIMSRYVPPAPTPTEADQSPVVTVPTTPGTPVGAPGAGMVQGGIPGQPNWRFTTEIASPAYNPSGGSPSTAFGAQAGMLVIKTIACTATNLGIIRIEVVGGAVLVNTTYDPAAIYEILQPPGGTIKVTIDGTVATSGGNIILEISQAKARKFGSVGGGFSPLASPLVAAFEPHSSWRQGDLLIGFTSGGGYGTRAQCEPDAIDGWTWVGSFAARQDTNDATPQRTEGVGIYTRTYQGEGLLTIETGNVPDWNGSGYFHDVAWGYSVTAYRFATPLSGILGTAQKYVVIAPQTVAYLPNQATNGLGFSFTTGASEVLSPHFNAVGGGDSGSAFYRAQYAARISTGPTTPMARETWPSGFGSPTGRVSEQVVLAMECGVRKFYVGMSFGGGGGAYQFRRGRRAHIAGATGVSIQGR